jgi:hypothetical protein
MYDYFSAASDELAASTIDLTGGPGGPVHLPMQAREIIRLHGREALQELTKPRLQRAETGFYAVSTKGFDPVTDLGMIEATITGTDYEVLLNRPRHGREVAIRDSGGVQVLTISDELRAVLANTGSVELSAAARQFADEEGKPSGAPLLAHLLSELAALARGAIERNERLYCWICLLPL